VKARKLLMLLVTVSLLPVPACDRAGGGSEDESQARWAEVIEAHAAPPTVDEGAELAGDETLVVLMSEETKIGEESLPKNPTVMEVAQLLDDGKLGEHGWVVWTSPDVPVRRLARTVQKLEMAGDEPTVHLAVDVSGGDGDPEIRGVPLAPAPNDELAADNAWAAHAPAETPVSEFVGTYRERLRSRGEKLEDFSE